MTHAGMIMLVVWGSGCSTARELAAEFVTPVEGRVDSVEGDVATNTSLIQDLAARLDAVEAENVALHADLESLRVDAASQDAALRDDLDAVSLGVDELGAALDAERAARLGLDAPLAGYDGYEVSRFQSDTSVKFTIEKGATYVGRVIWGYPYDVVQGFAYGIPPNENGLDFMGKSCDADTAQRGTWDLKSASCVEVSDSTWQVTVFAESGNPVQVILERVLAE